MSWTSTRDKELFFEALDQAFNTPSSEAVVVPQIWQNDNEYLTKPLGSPSKLKKHKPELGPRAVKKRRITSKETLESTTRASNRPSDGEIVKRQSAAKKSSETSRKSSDVAKEPRKSSLLDGMVLYFIPNSKKNGVRRFRMSLFAQHGADIRDTWSNDITHVICDKTVTGDRILRDLVWEQFPPEIRIVNELWIPECLAAGKFIDLNEKQFRVPGIQPHTTADSPSQKTHSKPSLQTKPVDLYENTEDEKDDDNSTDIQDMVFGCRYSPDPAVLEPQDALERAIHEIRSIGTVSTFLEYESTSETEPSGDETSTRVDIPAWQRSYQCMHPHDGRESQNNPNAKTIEVLSKMQAYYERTMDEWRAISYRKVISILKKRKEYVCTEEHARAIPGIGERIARKIVEIARTGELQRLQNLDSSDHTIELFMGIYGVGKTKALKFVMQGYRTLQELLERADLNESQRIGIQLYDDFTKRIPRDEVSQHSDIVKGAALEIDSTLQVHTMGSYRRGAKTCGDIDLIITKPQAAAADLMHLMVPLLESLGKSGFITHTLATSHNDHGSKWIGVSRLANGIYRRLDLLFVPWKERGAAFIYFTGNDIFNRSLRLLASKKGMGLNQRGLFKDTLRGPMRVKLTRGTLLASESEQEIFKILGVPWRPPELRNC